MSYILINIIFLITSDIMGQNMCHNHQPPPPYEGKPREKGLYEGDVDDLGRPDGHGILKHKDGSMY